MNLNLEDKKFLIKVCRDALWANLTNEELPAYYKDKELYRKKLGVFLRFFFNKKIRAYSGVLQSEEDLISTIQKVTKLAGFNDFRFSPIRNDEYNDLRIQLILVEDIIKINTLSELDIQKEGLMIKSNIKHSITFPWDLPDEYSETEFINTAFYKADIEKDDINKVELYSIKCEIIDETKLEITPINY